MPTGTANTKREQQQRGQYFTPTLLCDLMLALAHRYHPQPQRILEPACGNGIFFRRLWAREQALPTQSHWTGIEPESNAYNDTLQWLRSLPESAIQPTMLAENFLQTSPDTLGSFDFIIGNPPYIRQELLSQLARQDKKVRQTEFKALFANYFQEFPEAENLLSPKADLYQWFFLQAYPLLKTNGVLTFVVSNSWLDTQFGKALQHFLLHHFHWLALVESGCERWFLEAAINPVIIVLRKKSDNSASEHQSDDRPCQFIRLQRPLQDWLPDSKHPAYWQTLQAQVNTLETASADFELQTYQPAQLMEIHRENRWNMALRSPKPLQSITRQADLWMRLDELGSVRYPLKTGINNFFYLSRPNAQALRIEPEFLVPVLRSSKQVQTLIIEACELETVAFCCPATQAELTERNQIGALHYIEWATQQQAASRQKRALPIPWPQVPSVQGNQPWYHLKRLPTAHLLCNRFVDQRYFFARCEGDFMEDQTFYGVTLFQPEKYSPDLIAGLLNCTLACALLEFSGRASLGEGVLQFARCDMVAFPVLNPDLYSRSEQLAIQAAFTELAQQPLKSWQQDGNSPFRIRLDEAVLGPILTHLPKAIDVIRFRTELAQALLKRIGERKAMARSSRRKTVSTLV